MSTNNPHIAGAVVPPHTTPYSNLISPIDFPFNFLHAEIVRYLRERDAEIAEKKTEWLRRVKQSDFSESINSWMQSKEKTQLISSQIFAQVC